ncbi:unnamed protein product [Rhodiola kirilowii]
MEIDWVLEKSTRLSLCHFDSRPDSIFSSQVSISIADLVSWFGVSDLVYVVERQRRNRTERAAELDRRIRSQGRSNSRERDLRKSKIVLLLKLSERISVITDIRTLGNYKEVPQA